MTRTIQHHPINRFFRAAPTPTALWLHALRALCITLAILANAAAFSPAQAQSSSTAGAPEGSRPAGLDFENRPIRSVAFEGLVGVPEQAVLNQTRVRAGDPFDRQAVQSDVATLTRIGRFARVYAEVEPLASGEVDLVYRFDELPLLSDLTIIGASRIANEKLRGLVRLRQGDPIDRNLILEAQQRIVAEYRSEGFPQAEVRVDEDLLANSGTLVLQVREGPRVRVREIRFEGNTVFPDRQLAAQIQTKRAWGFPFRFLRPGTLNREQLELDDAAVRDFYRDRGYLDARVGSEPALMENPANAAVIFHVQEGPRYVVDSVRFEGAELFSDEQLRARCPLKPGAVYRQQSLEASVAAVRELYARLGYLDTLVAPLPPEYRDDGSRVNVVMQIREGTRARVGEVRIRGNAITRDRVVLHAMRRIEPGRYFDQTAIDETRRRLVESRLFGNATITVLGEPGDEYRDVVIEVEERSTGSVIFNAGVNSDLGIIGGINITQYNFDLLDFPNSIDELISQNAFRGNGQTFRLSIEPGTEVSRYSVSLSEPRFLDSDFGINGSLTWFNREREDYDESRASIGLGVGRRFGDIWSANVSARLEWVDIDSIELDAPVDVFAVEGNNPITNVGFSVVRDTSDSSVFPTTGSRSVFRFDQAGLLGGDFEFSRVSLSYSRYWTVAEDFLGRKTRVNWSFDSGYILQENEAPLFERFYAGGNDFRGFRYRGVGPRGIRANDGLVGNDPVGGQFMFLTSLEYEFPLDPSGGDVFRWVVFTDMGTVQDDFGFDQWRWSVGTGARIQMPFLFGSAPFALDFAIPLNKEDGDETRILSFTLDLPFN